ncbi:hypothetical protein [Occallatibacter riparius]|uniref:Uncharacterized protein n=1 Tax=Occallatibacter riparius TaxID=1002689 RepID=A0A9J7BYC1_9BACT|nr:hypothetical protein [Occallatibacter riparius]UWZ86214.1 hypothetical protein MOP44_09770 [Occallatibacter riparius]
MNVHRGTNGGEAAVSRTAGAAEGAVAAPQVLSFTPMEIPAGPSQPVQLRIALDRAEIQADASAVRRTAHFTDGSIRTLAIHWDKVNRIVAFRRDVLTAPVASVAISDPHNIVVLDEQMHGWPALVEALPNRIALAPTYPEWLTQANSHDPQSSHWTILFRAQP